MKLRVQLQCKNLHEYLKELSPEILDRLYNHPATCLAVYRELPPLAKNYVMRMLFLDQPLPQAAVALWVKKDSEKDHDQCVSVLSGLRLWHSQQLQGGLQGNILNPIFKDNLRIALLGGGKSWADQGDSLGPDRHARDVESLDKYALERWEVVLHFMVGCPSAAVSQDLSQLLIQAGLMRTLEGTTPPGWPSLYSGFIVVETNYRLYAYTNSELQIALVALFSECLYRFPNVVVAQVTRESVQQAIANGITAQQILHFLRTRAHPVMLKQNPVLPPTITDQIRLWELERDRLQFSEGVLYNQFLSQADFEVLRDRAQVRYLVLFSLYLSLSLWRLDVQGHDRRPLIVCVCVCVRACVSQVNEAEEERLRSEREHQRVTQLCQEAEQRVQTLQKSLKRVIVKSKPYFELKAQFNHILEEHKANVVQLEERVAKVKMRYSVALRNLEQISEQIHAQRGRVRATRAHPVACGGRSSPVGAEAEVKAVVGDWADGEKTRQWVERHREQGWGHRKRGEAGSDSMSDISLQTIASDLEKCDSVEHLGDLSDDRLEEVRGAIRRERQESFVKQHHRSVSL
ncbi:unnamed protein product [Oncorhynchus mykiss]|uniref:Multifunctional fusion protein n=1 Tax=Oncorhynchus mykiss TaxID=8022 RepID=A0A060Y436_ONCMY|nr:unnamed protein product [Oncorhynchus mykiss]